jgi:hypothetical protein
LRIGSVCISYLLSDQVILLYFTIKLAKKVIFKAADLTPDTAALKPDEKRRLMIICQIRLALVQDFNDAVPIASTLLAGGNDLDP